MKNWKAYILVFGLLFGASSCVFEEHVPEPVVADAEMRLTVSINAGTRAGDPGIDHGEENPNWETLGVYIVYTTGRVLSFSVPKANYTNPKVFSVFEGTAKVYAVAFPKGQTPPVCDTEAEVQNLRTLNIADISGTTNKQNYIQNIFSGISQSASIKKNQDNTIHVACTRLAAKIDVQWDAQGAYADGKYVQASMSEITHDGLAEGYIFPTVATISDMPAEILVDATYSANDPISERNGRTYFYTFPGGTSAINFSVTYTPGTGGTLAGKQNYKASFPNTIESNTWYKVNINVSGTKASVTEGWVLGQSTGN